MLQNLIFLYRFLQLFTNYFGSEENITLQDNCMYIFIWLDDYIIISEGYLPEPDIKLHVDSQDFNCKSEIFVYKFENK